MKKYLLKTSTVTTLSLLVTFALVPQVWADQSLQVIENGADSQSNVSVNSSNNTNVEQANHMNVINTVESKAETGGNAANQNTNGQQTIVTGDANISNEITTTGNQSVVDASCCQTTSTSTTITGNGAGTENTITHTNTNQTTITVLNNATIVNNISIKANTGKNRASFNTGGDTIIKTGDINVINEIINAPVNVSKVKVVEGSKELKSFLQIAGNGAFSENIIEGVNENITIINENNFANLFNNVEALMNTGKNDADFNTGGDTVIVTGDIFAKTIIENIANFNVVEVVCGCEKEKEKPQKPEKPKEEIPSQPEAPAPPTTSVGGPGGPSAPGNGHGVAGPILPVTGNNLLFFLLVANIMMFFLGMYLRLRSGRSPGYSYSL